MGFGIVSGQRFRLAPPVRSAATPDTPAPLATVCWTATAILAAFLCLTQLGMMLAD